MKRTKRLLILLLVIATVMVNVPVSVFAAGTGGIAESIGPAEIAFGKVSGQGGEKVTVPVTIRNNPGIASFRFRIAYDNTALTYLSAAKGEAMPNGILNAAYQDKDQELAITWFDVKNISEDGVIFNLVFEVAETAGGQYPLTVRYLPEDIVNAAWQQVDMTVTDGWIQTGSAVSGTVTSFGTADAEVTVQLKQHNTVVDSIVSTDGTYRFGAVVAGAYTLVVSKHNHATRVYDLTVGDEGLVQDVKIHLIGDITGDGKVNVADTSKVYSQVKGTATLDDYAFACGDVDGNGKLNVADTSKIYSHAKGTRSLW